MQLFLEDEIRFSSQYFYIFRVWFYFCVVTSYTRDGKAAAAIQRLGGSASA